MHKVLRERKKHLGCAVSSVDSKELEQRAVDDVARIDIADIVKSNVNEFVLTLN